MRVCDYCGTSIEGKRVDARFCDARCRAKAGQRAGHVSVDEEGDAPEARPFREGDDDAHAHLGRPRDPSPDSRAGPPAAALTQAEVSALIDAALHPIRLDISDLQSDCTQNYRTQWIQERVERLERMVWGRIAGEKPPAADQVPKGLRAQIRALTAGFTTHTTEQTELNDELAYILSAVLTAFSEHLGIDLRAEIREKKRAQGGRGEE